MVIRHQIPCIPEERWIETHANFKNTVCPPAIGARNGTMYSQTRIAGESDGY
jgi:hypothetical protein